MRSFIVYGLVATATFQKCTEASEYINQHFADMFNVAVAQEVPRDFHTRKSQMIESGLLNEGDESLETVVVENENTAISGDVFLQQMLSNTTFKVLPLDRSHPDSYENRALYSWKVFLHNRGNSYCWMDILIDNQPAGRITFELYSKVLPRTCSNFWRMCRGNAGSVVPEGETEAIELAYKNTTFFRILKDAWVMGGDVSKGHTGNGGYSCYGRYFPDESFAIPHDDAGVLGMCNDGEHTNSSKFYITRKKLSWLNRRYVAFGRVIDGMPVVDAVHAVKVKHNQAPCVPIVIIDCGIIDVTM